MQRIKSLNRLQRLVNTLDQNEVNTAQKFLDFHSASKQKTQVKELLNQSVRNEKINRKNYRNNEVLRKVSEELSKKIHESLILDSQIDKQHGYPLQIRKIIKLNKLYIQALVLEEKGLDLNALKLIERIVIQAKEYELYDELLKALYWKRNYYGIRSQEAYEQVNKEVNTYESHRAIKHLADKKIADLVYRKNIIAITDSIEELNFYNDKIKSKYVAYVISYLQFLFNEEENDQVACNRLLNKMLKMVKNTPLLNSNKRFFSLQLDLNRNLVLLEKHEKAQALNSKICNALKIGSKQYMLCKELGYFNAYLKGDYSLASKQIENLVNEKSGSTHHKNTYYLMLAFSEYQLKQFESTQKCLEKVHFLPSEVYLNFEKRIIEAFNSIRLQEYDCADKLIEALRKYATRHPELKREKRLKLISSLLIALRSKSYNFKLVKQKCARKITELKQIESEIPITIEVIGLFKASQQF